MRKTGKSAFSFWKNSFLPAKIQLILLKICNHKLKLNSQLKHFTRDENGERVKPECTFCILSNEDNPSEESYRHFFLECKHSRNFFVPVSTKYNIPIPNTVTKGELIIYFFPWEGFWDEARINIYYAIYKYYLLSCRTRKILPTANHFEITLKFEIKNIALTNPMNSGLTQNLLPLWTGKELTKTETIELLEEVEGKTDKAKLFDYSNKNTVVLKTSVLNNFRFPIVTKDYATHRLNERKNNQRIKYKLFND